MARTHGEGSIYPRKRDGKITGFTGSLRYVDATGKSSRATVYGKTRKEVVAKLRGIRDRIDNGSPAKDSSQTVGDWLKHWRETTLAASDRKASTRQLYSDLSRKHLEPEPFGTITLDRLRPSDIEALVLTLRERGLADSSVRSIYTVARAALDGAVRDGLLARNPAAAVNRPGIQRKEAKHLEPAEVARLLAALDGHRYLPAVTLIAYCGLRKGECLALRWADVDLDAGTLKVSATLNRVNGSLVISEPKTARSRRVVPLSADLVARLTRHRTAQKREKLAAANQWTDSGLVFTTELGTPVEPRNFLRVVQSAAAQAGLEGVDVHTLRHSTATAWMAAGVPIRVVADLLGHSSISVTGDLYQHVCDDTARAAVEGLAGVFTAGSGQ
jgi:integrase